MKLMLHIGAHRTGTSLIQSTIRSHCTLDMRRQLFCAGPYAMVDTSQKQVATAVKRVYEAHKDGHSPKRAAPFFVGIESQCRDDFECVLYSNENLCGGLGGRTPFYMRAPYIAHSLDAARLEDPRIIVYIRRQSDWLVSAYCQMSLRKRHMTTLNRMPSLYDYATAMDLQSLSWQALVAPFVDVLGHERVVVIPMEIINDLGAEEYLNVFSRRFWTGERLTLADTAHPRRRLSLKGRLLIERAMPLLSHEELVRLSMWSEHALFPTSDEQFPTLPRLFDRAIMRFHEDSNRNIFENLVPAEFACYYERYYDPGAPEVRIADAIDSGI